MILISTFDQFPADDFPYFFFFFSF
jgi:hypothetical protein